MKQMTEEEAKEILKTADYSLPEEGGDTMLLDGHFTAKELQACIVVMTALKAAWDSGERYPGDSDDVF